jgi:hypothetical protein
VNRQSLRQNDIIEANVIVIQHFGLRYYPVYILIVTFFPALIYLYTLLGFLIGQTDKRTLEKIARKETQLIEQSV